MALYIIVRNDIIQYYYHGSLCTFIKVRARRSNSLKMKNLLENNTLWLAVLLLNH